MSMAADLTSFQKDYPAPQISLPISFLRFQMPSSDLHEFALNRWLLLKYNGKPQEALTK